MALEEVLVGLALTAVVTGTALELGGRAWRYCKEAITFTRMSQETLLLRTAWRRFVHDCPSPPALTDTGDLAAGEWRASLVPGTLSLRRGAEVRVRRLPEGMTAEIRREGQPGEPARWILALAWKGRTTGETRNGRTRLVACRQEATP